MIWIYLVDFDRKHSTVSKTVKIVSMSITDLILLAETWEKVIQEVGFFFGGFLFNAITVSIKLGLKLQFLCLPLDVNSLKKLFQACILINEGETPVSTSGTLT